ncbi:MAG TPA: tetratricopeptide repeat protein [bacterium]|nr:tetratricopeptide repeat protein [bacterium]
MQAAPITSWIKKRRWPLIVFAVALLPRLVFVLTTSDQPLYRANVADAYEYEVLADRILAGDLGAGREVFFHSSAGYPYILALVWAVFGKSLLAARLIQVLAGALNAVVLLLLARRLFGGETEGDRRRGEIVGRIAGLGAALYGYIAFLELDLLMTAYELLAINLGLLWLVKFLDERRWRHLVGAGLAFGFASLGRPNVWLVAVVLAVFIIFVLWRRWKWKALRALGAGALVVGLCFALILPVTLRNAVTADDPVLLTSNAGVNLWIGNNENATGYWGVPGDMRDRLFEASRKRAEAASGRVLKPSEVSTWWMERAGAFIVKNPVRALGLFGKKALLFFNAYEMPNHLDYYFVRARGGWALWLMPLGFWLVMPLGLTGLILWRPWGDKHRLIAVFVILYFLMVVGLFVTGRYRAPVVGPLIPFAAWALYDLWGKLRGKDRRGLGKTVLVLVPAAVLVNWGVWHTAEAAYSWGVLAEACDRLEDSEGAVRALEEAVREEPDNPFFYNNLGLHAQARGDLEEAERLLREGYEFSGKNPDNAANLAQVLAQRGKEGEAVTVLQDALAMDPRHTGCLSNLAAVYFRLGRPDVALAYVEESLRWGGGAPQTYSLAVYACLSLGRTDRAEGYMNQGLALFPEDQGLWATKAQLLLSTGDLDGAREALRRARELTGDDPRLGPLAAQLGP